MNNTASKLITIILTWLPTKYNSLSFIILYWLTILNFIINYTIKINIKRYGMFKIIIIFRLFRLQF